MSSSQTQSWIAIARNPTSGSGAGRRELLHLISRLRERGYLVRMYKSREKLRDELDCPERRENLKCLIGAGGDGTIAGLINAYPGLPVAILPMGTENLFAKHIGITRSGKRLADVVIDGNVEEFDLGEVNGRKFFLMVSAGFDADVVHRLDAIRTGNISKASYLQPIWNSWRKYRYPELRVTVDEGDEVYCGSLALISNLPCYAMQLPFAKTAHPDDGLLDLRLFRKGSRISTISYLASVATGQHEKRDDVLCLRGRHFRLESDRPIPLQADGDPSGTTPATIEISTSRALFVVPKTYQHSLAGHQT